MGQPLGAILPRCVRSSPTSPTRQRGIPRWRVGLVGIFRAGVIASSQRVRRPEQTLRHEGGVMPTSTIAEPTITQLFDLTGKTALLTGGTGHLGSAMARALAEAGASVVLTSRDAGRAQAAADALP